MEEKENQTTKPLTEKKLPSQAEESASQHLQKPAAQPSKKAAKKGLYSTQSTLQIAEIRDGIVILKDGSFRVVIEAESINFDLMNTIEQEAIEFAYQSFVNSLYFPIQINIQSRRVDAEAYLKKIQTSLRQQNNMLLALLIEDYLHFIEDLIDNTDIMDKKFYVIIPFYNNEFSKEAASNASKNLVSKLLNFNKTVGPLGINETTLDKAKRELRYRIQVIMEGLRNCGVESRPLGTQELIEMYYEYYNPETTVSQPLGDFDDLSTPFVSKVGDYRHNEKHADANKPVESDKEESSALLNAELETLTGVENQPSKNQDLNPPNIQDSPQIISDINPPPSHQSPSQPEEQTPTGKDV